jgi:CheY-like chemotaxis protein
MTLRSNSRPAPPARILLVDDNRSGLSARKAILAEFGHTVDCAEDAASGLKLFERHRYDLVVTDFRMPDMDGTRFIAELRKRKPDVPIVLLSGFVEALGLNEHNTGADTVIMKNAREVHHLTSTVHRLLTTARKPPASEAAPKRKAARKTGRT